MSIYNDIDSKLDELYSKISSKNLEWADDLKKVLKLFIKGHKIDDFIPLLDSVCNELSKNVDFKNNTNLASINNLNKLLKQKSPDYLLERIMSDSYRVSKNKELKEALNNQIYKIMEATRTGKRDVVIGILLRIFVVHKQEFPKSLIQALKQEYDDNLFKSFIYAFLSNFIDNNTDK